MGFACRLPSAINSLVWSARINRRSPWFSPLSPRPFSSGSRKPERQSSTTGVYWDLRSQKWRILLQDPRSNERLHLGYFIDEDAAASFAECAKMQLHQKEGGVSSNSVSPLFYAEVAKHIETVRHRKQSSSYNGVSAYTNMAQGRPRTFWTAQMTEDGKTKHLGKYITEEGAARAFDLAFRGICRQRKALLRRLNFKNDDDYFKHETWQSEPVPEKITSRFIGVSLSGKRWKATTLRGIERIGYFVDEVDAAIAFDKASLARGEPTNFNPKEYSVSPPGSDKV